MSPAIFNKPHHQKLTELTEEVMSNPQPGDQLHEMFSFWVLIIARDGNNVTVCECHGPTDDALRDFPPRVTTVAELKEKYAYKSIPGYSIMASERTP